MYTGLLHLHRTTGIIAFILVLVAAIYFAIQHFSKKQYSNASKKVALFTLIFAHVQLILGFILYFVSPIVSNGLANMANTMKDASLRFWVVEHLSTMLFAIVFITIGYSSAKRATNDAAKNKKTFIFFFIGLILMLLRFPWERIGF